MNHAYFIAAAAEGRFLEEIEIETLMLCQETSIVGKGRQVLLRQSMKSCHFLPCFISCGSETVYRLTIFTYPSVSRVGKGRRTKKGSTLHPQ